MRRRGEAAAAGDLGVFVGVCGVKVKRGGEERQNDGSDWCEKGVDR